VPVLVIIPTAVLSCTGVVLQLEGHYNSNNINSLNAELNSICHLLALLGAYPILHISRIRVNINMNIYKYLWLLDQMPMMLCDRKFSFMLFAYNCSRRGFSVTQP
jgi:hypothetical protein